jgi:HD-like signal output (HDOD) protein
MSLSRDSIISLGSKLPPALGIFGRLRTLLDDVDCDVEAISELVEMDPALTFQVIRLSNSATYGLGARCQSLDEAIGRVGFNEIHQLVGLIVSRQAFQGDLAQYGIPASRLWENAVATGALASVFAARSGQDAGGAYSGGLMRNIGKVILNNHAGTPAYPGEEVAPDLFAWEKATYGVTSAEATATLLDHWRFPLEIAGAICTHAAPGTAAEFTAGAAILHLACACAAEWGSGLPGEAALWHRDQEMYELAGIDESVLEGAVADARRQFSRFALLEWPKTPPPAATRPPVIVRV